jgi:hypothetical protein
MFRILIASRDEKDIRSAFSQLNVERVHLHTDDDAAACDIAEYFRQRLASIAQNSELSDWPKPGVIEQLTRSAGGLFIWASTAVGFIEDGPPDERLQILFDISMQGESLTQNSMHSTKRLSAVNSNPSFRAKLKPYVKFLEQ